VLRASIVLNARGLGNPVRLASPGSPVRAQHVVQGGAVGRRSRLDDDRSGLGVAPGLARRRPSAYVGNARHYAYPRRTELPVSIWCGLLTATAARARLHSGRPCAPVMSARWGVHGVKIQAL
jgi:hypothetical protein